MASTINATTASGGGVITTADATGNLNIQANGANVISILNDGNVGIGTSTISTGNKLAVYGGNIQIGTTGTGIVFSDSTRQTTAAVATAAPTGTVVTYLSIIAATTATSGTGSVATVTFNATYAVPVGASVVIAGVTPAGYNGIFVVTASTSVAGASTVSFASSTTGSQTVAGTLYNAPADYLKQDGSYYLRSAYPTLAAMIGAPLQLSTETQTYTASAPRYDLYVVNNIFFASGTATAESTAASTASALITSTDGVTWTSRTAVNPIAVAYNGSIYVMLANPAYLGSQVLWTSTDLSTWTKRTGVLQAGYYAGAIAYGGTGGNFVILSGTWDNCNGFGFGTTIAYSSTNGTTWTAMTATSPATGLAKIAAYSGAVIALGSATTKVFYSATGAGAWTEIATGVAGAVTYYDISYANSRFILTTSGGIYTSTTGATGTWSLIGAVPVGTPAERGKYIWNGTLYYSNWTGKFSTDLITFYSASELTNLGISYGVSYYSVFDNKFYGRSSSGAVKYVDANAYTTATQFPIGYVSTGATTTDVVKTTPFFAKSTFIKT